MEKWQEYHGRIYDYVHLFKHAQHVAYHLLFVVIAMKLFFNNAEPHDAIYAEMLQIHLLAIGILDGIMCLLKAIIRIIKQWEQ